MAKIVDPDSLNQSTDDGAGIPDGEVFIDTTAKTIELMPVIYIIPPPLLHLALHFKLFIRF